MRIRLLLCRWKQLTTSARVPGLCWMRMSREVRSLPLGCVSWRPMTAKRVVLQDWSCTSSSRMFRPNNSAASGQPRDAAPMAAFSLARMLAFVVEDVSTSSAFGKCRWIQFRVWPRTWGWEYRMRMCSRGISAIRLLRMFRLTWAQILRGEVTKRSITAVTEPSEEFSTGTTPYWAFPRSTMSNTSLKLWHGMSSQLFPNCLRAAWWLQVPLGPR